MFINGKAVTTDSKLYVYSPYTNEFIDAVGASKEEDVNKAIENAYEAFKTNKDQLSSYEKYNILSNVYNIINARFDEIARLITHESGKIIRESEVEVKRALYVLQYAAEESKRIHGEILPCDITDQKIEKNAYVHRKPIGVVAAITPFNFPLNTVVHKVAPAIASGNSIVLKPSPTTPLTAELLAEIFIEAGLPEDMFNIVQGDAETGQLLISHNKVRMVTFTGSVATGTEISHNAGMKKLTLELGGNDPLVVFSDADLQKAATMAIEQGLGTCGQRCTAVKRVFVEQSVYDQFLDILIPRINNLKVGDPFDREVDIGPMVDSEAAKSIESLVAETVSAGANSIIYGQRENAIHNPVLLSDVPSNCNLIKEETFGPVLPVNSFSNIDDLICEINNTKYGLQAGVFTENLSTIQKMFTEVEVGTLIVNGGPGFRVDSLPFGGVKSSGLGREGVLAAVKEMTEEVALIM